MFHGDGWMHPLFACAAHYSIVIASCIFVNDILFLSLSPFTGDISLSQCHQFKTSRLIGPHESRISSFLIFYTVSLLISRLVAKRGAARKAVLYEYTWLCNSTLILGVIGLRYAFSVLDLFEHYPFICCLNNFWLCNFPMYSL